MKESRLVITQGEHAISRDGDTCISTLLGSCVACCMWDPVEGIGGMNHMLLAHRPHSPGSADLSGINEMELLINGLLKLGARRDRLLAKAFGGASMVSGLSDIGASNGDFTLKFLSREGIECVSHSLGGTLARQLVFWPVTGVVRQKLVNAAPPQSINPAQTAPTGNGVELW